jgi:hypothetical protein
MRSVSAGRPQPNLGAVTTVWYKLATVVTFIPMLTSPLFFIITAPLLLSFYIQRFCRKKESQRAAVLLSLGLDNARDDDDDDARNKKKKFIGFFHPYW